MPTFDMLGIVLRSHRAPFDLSIDPQSCLIWWLTRHRELSLLLFQSQPRKREGEVTNGKCSYCTSLLASTVGFHGWTGEDGKRIRCKISMSQLSLPNFWRKSWFTTEFEPFVPSSIISRLPISWLSWAPQGINQLAGKNCRKPKREIFPMHQCFYKSSREMSLRMNLEEKEHRKHHTIKGIRIVVLKPISCRVQLVLIFKVHR